MKDAIVRLKFWLIGSLGLMILPLVSSAMPAQAFSDIAQYSYKTSIDTLAERGVVEGYADGTYRPDQPVNRAEFLKIVLESQNIKADLSASSFCFPDVTDEWFAPYVCTAKQKEIVAGYPDGMFKPDQPVNYVEALKMTYGANHYSPTEDTIPTRDGWYYIYLEDAQAKGIALQELNPDDLITRGQMAELMVRFINRINTPPEKQCALRGECQYTRIPIAEADFETCRVLPGCSLAADKNNVYKRLVDFGSSTVYDYRIAKGVDPVTVEVLNSSFFKDKNAVYYDAGWEHKKLTNVDTSTAQAVSYHFIKDKNHVYYGQPYEVYTTTYTMKILEGVDTPTFEVVGNVEESYFKDINHVYHLNDFISDSFENGSQELSGIDFSVLGQYNPTDFRAVGDYYIHDSKVYFSTIDQLAEISLGGVDTNSFKLIEEPYYRDNKHIYYNNAGFGRTLVLIEGADPETFKILDAGKKLAKDKNFVYYQNSIIQNADPGSFEIHGGYYKDQSHIYNSYYDLGTADHITRAVEGIDAKTFEALKEGYFKDKNNIYVRFSAIDGADLPTFEVLSSYAKDKIFVYWNGKIIEKADAASFETLISNEGYNFGDYAKDKNTVFYKGNSLPDRDVGSFRVLVGALGVDKNGVCNKGKAIASVDPLTFQVLDWPYYKDKNSVWVDNNDTFYRLPSDPLTFQSLSVGYGKDKNNVYYYDAIVQTAHSATFQVIDYNYSKDQYRVYFQGEPIQTPYLSLRTLKMLDYGYSKDQYRVYFETSVIKGADPTTFEVVSPDYARDKNHIYVGGTIVEDL